MSSDVKYLQKWTTRGDGFDNLSRSSDPLPKPGKNEVLIEIKAVSLNYRDTEGKWSPYCYINHLRTAQTELIHNHIHSHHGSLQPPQNHQLPS